MAQHELADRLDGNRSHAVGYLDHLQALELVARERDPSDRRRQNVTLTQRGRSLLDTLAHDVARATDALLRPLSAAERETLRRGLALGHVPTWATPIIAEATQPSHPS